MQILVEVVMVYQKYYCPSYLYTSYSITGPLDRVRLSASGIITRVIIFDNLLKIKKRLSLQGWHTPTLKLIWSLWDKRINTSKLFTGSWYCTAQHHLCNWIVIMHSARCFLWFVEVKIVLILFTNITQILSDHTI